MNQLKVCIENSPDPWFCPCSYPPETRVQTIVIARIFIFGRPLVKRFALCYRTVVCLSVCNVGELGVFWPNGRMDYMPP